MPIIYNDILRARQRITPHILRTPLVRSTHLSDLTDGNVFLKLENQQLLNSFKIRGMANRVLAMNPDERRRGVIVASAGNHGIAASYCGAKWDVAVEVVIPEGTPQTKIEKMRTYGAEIVVAGRSYDEAAAICRQRRAKSRKVYVDPAADEVAVAGHGTIGLEILEDCPQVDAILVPVGGGGLVTGVSLAAKTAKAAMARAAARVASPASGSPTPAAAGPTSAPAGAGLKVIGIQTEACPAMKVSLEQGVFHEQYPSQPSVCEGLVGGIGAVGWAYAAQCLDEVALVSEAAILRAVVSAIDHEKIVAEASGAVGLAYVAENPEVFRGRDVVIVVSGGNLDFGLVVREVLREAEEA